MRRWYNGVNANHSFLKSTHWRSARLPIGASKMHQSLKLTDKPIHAGFPNAADEANYNKLNLHKLLIKRPASTFFMRLEGSLHPKTYKHTETFLIVDRSPKIKSGDLLVISYRGELAIKTYKVVKGRHWLLSVRDGSRAIELTDDDNIVVWGVVLHIIESTRGIEQDSDRGWGE